MAAHMAQLSHLQALRGRGERAYAERWEGCAGAEQIAALEAELAGEMEEWARVRREVAAAIAAAPKESHRLLLEYRYLCGWELRRTAIRMNYSVDRMWHLHAEALREFRVPDKDQQVTTGEQD